MAQYDFGQELWPDDRTLSSISWRDRLRDLAQDYGGERGRQKAEQLIGESEEDKYMRMLLQEYGYEGVPEDAPTERSFMQSVIDPADIGGVDMGLMGASALGSVAPKLAATSAGTETSLLLGDAIGEYNEGNIQGAGLMLLLAAAPGLLNILSRGGQQAKEGIETLAEETPLLLDESKRNFLKASGVLTAGGIILGKTMKNTPTVSIKDDVAKVAETVATKIKDTQLNTWKFFDQFHEVYHVLPDEEFYTFDSMLPSNWKRRVSPKITETPDNRKFYDEDLGYRELNVETSRSDEVEVIPGEVDFQKNNLSKQQNDQHKLVADFFEEQGYSPNDLLHLEEDGGAYDLSMENIFIRDKIDKYRVSAEDDLTRYTFVDEKGKETGFYLETYTVDGVPMASYGDGEYEIDVMPRLGALDDRAELLEEAGGGITTLVDDSPALEPVLKEAGISRREALVGAGATAVAATGLGIKGLAKRAAKVAETAAPAAKMSSPQKFLEKAKDFYRAIDQILEEGDFEDFDPRKMDPEEYMIPPQSLPEPTKITTDSNGDEVILMDINPTKEQQKQIEALGDADEELIALEFLQQATVQKDFFKKYGVEEDDLIGLDDEQGLWEVTEILEETAEEFEDIPIHIQFADPNSIKRYRFGDDVEGVEANVDTYTVDGVPVVRLNSASGFESAMSRYITVGREALEKLID